MLSWSWTNGWTWSSYKRDEVIAHALETEEGRLDLARAMVEPFRRALRLPGIGRA